MKYITVVAIIAVFLLSACGTTTVLLVNFRDDTIGSPPVTTQTTGTATVNAGSGSVTVVETPGSGLPANKWARITHHSAPSPETTLTGNFSRFFGTGKYAVLVAMFIPSGAGVATVQFEASNPAASFFHLDFMPEGDVRIDDGDTRFGSFPRNQSFVLSVNLNTGITNPTAEIALLGGSATGNITVPIRPIFIPVARQFNAVKFWMGFQHNGNFFVDDIFVTRKK